MSLKSFFHSRRNVVIVLSLVGALCVASVVLLSVMFSREKKAVKELNDRILLNESRELAFRGERMLEEGRLTDAEKLALSILPKDISNSDRPYSVDAERLLRNCYMDRALLSYGLEMEGFIISVDDRYAYGSDSRWDLQTGKVERLCPEGSVGTELSPDLGTFIYQADSTVYALDLKTMALKSLYVLLPEESLEACIFDQMGARAVLCVASDYYSGDFYRALYIYDVETDELVDLNTRGFDSDPDEDVDYAFSNDGRWMAEVYEECEGGVVSVETWDLSDYSWKYAWTEDGDKRYDRNAMVDTYRMKDSLLVCGSNIVGGMMPLIGGLGQVCSVDVNRYTGDIVVLHEDEEESQCMSIYDENGNMKTEISIYGQHDCQFVSQDVIATHDMCRVYLYDAQTLEEIWMFNTGSEIDDVLISEDCSKLLVKEENDYRIFDLSGYVAKGAYVVASSEDYFVLSNGEVRDALDFELVMKVPASEMVSLAGDFLAVLLCDESDNLHVYDLKTGEKTYIRTISVGEYYEDAINLSSTGRYLAYYADDCLSVIMDLSSGETIYETDDWGGLTFCEDGVHVYGTIWADAHSGMMSLMNLDDAEEVYESDFVSHGLMVSSKGRFLIDQEDGMIVILESGEKVDVGINIDKEYCYAIWEEFDFSPSDEFFLIETETGLKVYETDTWTVVFEEPMTDIDKASFIGNSYMSVRCDSGDDMVTDVYRTDGWIKEYSYGGYYDCIPGLCPTDENSYGYVKDVFCRDADRVCTHFEEYGDYTAGARFLVWNRKVGGFIMSAAMPSDFDMKVFMTGNGDFIFSSAVGVRKVDMPDLQTLIDQTHARYGM